MYELDNNYEDQIAREHEKHAKCSHSYLKCGFCGMYKDELNNEYRAEISRLTNLLITHGIDPKNAIIS